MNCRGCGLPLSESEMGMNFKGEQQEYHGFQARCVELLREELYKKNLQLREAERKGRDLCQQNGELLMALRKIDTMRKRLPDPDFVEQKNTAAGIAEIIQSVLTEKRKCEHTACTCDFCKKDPICIRCDRVIGNTQ